jgi:hypothetical protein
MMSGRSKSLRVAVMVLACLGFCGTPAWAQPGKSCCCNCLCQGVDLHGCLTNCGGCRSTCCCVCNTKCYTFTACCRCKVQNCCKKSECYNNICFLQSSSYCCTYSCYTCDPCGHCCYTCGGTVLV